MRIVFIGTVEFSYLALEKIIALKGNIVGVCTKSQSNFNSDYKDLTPLCKKEKIAYKYVKDVNSQDNIKWIKELAPDVIFCFGWSNLIKKDLLNLAPLGVIGYHPAELPYNRGRHPIIWALALGLKQTASSFFFMDEGADSGDILSQKKIEIVYEDDAMSLYQKVVFTALFQIEEFLPTLQNKTFEKQAQKHQLANHWRKRGRQDGQIDFRMTSKSIYNLVRALTKPYIGAHLEYKDEEVKVWKVRELDCNLKNIEPGKVLDKTANSIIVKCHESALEILEHEFKVLPNVGEYL